MNGKGKYKFKVINGILSWKNDEMERFMPVSGEEPFREKEKWIENQINLN